MTAKQVQDLFLADDLRSINGGDRIAEAIDEAETHEEVETIKAAYLRFFDSIGADEL
jgi:hypothetical protein